MDTDQHLLRDQSLTFPDAPLMPPAPQASQQPSGLSQLAALFKPSSMSAPPSSSAAASIGDTGIGLSQANPSPSNLPASIPDFLSKIMGGSADGNTDSTSSAAASNTAGLMPLLKKYWPVILSTLAAIENRQSQRKVGFLHGQLPPNFTSPLPQVSGRGPSTPPSDNYYTYGEQPEHSYFSNNAIPTVMKARGGATHSSPLIQALSNRSRYVPSRGSNGRADDIDAKLSNNEYVIDAETTALLGDGSPDAGAKKLDRMRENIRKHKGKKLSKGKISPNAKEAEEYL